MIDTRAIAKLVLEPGWSIAGAIEKVTPEQVAEAIEAYQNVPALIHVDPRFESEEAATLRDLIKGIGMANWPDMPNKGEWLNAMLTSLSDLPVRPAISAARQTLHCDFRFPNEVKPKIREFAAAIIERHNLAIWRLKLMRDEIRRAANPQNQLEQHPEWWTQEMVDDANATFIKVKASTRYKLGPNGTVEAIQTDGVDAIKDDGYMAGSEGKPEI
jgi:hypothetical protein